MAIYFSVNVFPAGHFDFLDKRNHLILAIGWKYDSISDTKGIDNSTGKGLKETSSFCNFKLSRNHFVICPTPAVSPAQIAENAKKAKKGKKTESSKRK